MILRLSDAFGQKSSTGLFPAAKEPVYEWTAIMLNINYGRNKILMEKCQILQEYAILVDTIRKYQQEMDDVEESAKRLHLTMEEFEHKLMEEHHAKNP